MCGVAGCFDPRGAPLDERALAALRALGVALAHRGPDEGGFRSFGRCAFAHRRLAVQDLTPAAAQPMVHASGAALCYNGELYNVPALRPELEASGETFRGHGDAEVLLAGCAQWGAARAAERADGIFAFALFDPRDGSLTLGRDLAGVKPLYYGRDDAGLIWFASELGPLVDAAPLPRRIDRAALGAYAALGFVPGPRTIYEAVRALEPGTLRRFGGDGAETATRLAPPPAPDVPPYEDAPRRLLELVAAAVERQLVADVPVGLFLSGGLDSSCLAAVVSRLLGRDLEAFTIGYADEPVIDETAWAERVARHLGLRHVVHRVAAAEARAALEPVLAGCGQPFADPSLLPTWLVSRLARERAAVALSGDGADELFAGYRKYDLEPRRAAWQRVPRPLRRAAAFGAAALPSSRATRFGEGVRRARKFFAAAELDDAPRWLALQAPLAPVPRVLELYRGELRLDAAYALLAAGAAMAGRAPGLPAMLAADEAVTLPDRMLHKVDLASMAHGLEVRVPLLDGAVAAFARALPPDYKLGGGFRKRVLRDAALPLLPPEMARRPKQGFDMPVGRWLAGPLEASFLERIHDPAAARLLDVDAALRLLDRHKRRRVAADAALWSVYCLADWAVRRGGSLD